MSRERGKLLGHVRRVRSVERTGKGVTALSRVRRPTSRHSLRYNHGRSASLTRYMSHLIWMVR
eukprot:5908050-Prymnesium_polylepis.3